MKIVKRILSFVIVLSLIGVLFRGWIYRTVVTYKSLGERKAISIISPELLDFVKKSDTDKKTPLIKDITNQTLALTSRQLTYESKNTSSDPNELIHSKNAHCVGYASFFTTTCNFLLTQHVLSETWVAKHHIGQLYFLGYNVHQFFDDPFFRDHDFVTIENLVTGESFAVDPTLNDYFYIDRITIAK